MTDAKQPNEAVEGGRSRKLSAALHDVPVPAGLAERIVASWGELSRSASLESVATVATVATVARRDAAAGRQRWRARWFVATSFLLLATMLVGGGWVMRRWAHHPVPVASLDELSTDSIHWSAQLAPDWHAESEPVPAGYELSSPLRYSRAPWQILATAYDSRTVAYQLAARAEACLFVMQATCELLEDGGPCRRLPASAGWDVGAWRRGSRLFLLAARERTGRLEEYLQPPTRNVAKQLNLSQQFCRLAKRTDSFAAEGTTDETYPGWQTTGGDGRHVVDDRLAVHQRWSVRTGTIGTRARAAGASTRILFDVASPGQFSAADVGPWFLSSVAF